MKPTKAQRKWVWEQCGLKVSIKYPDTFYPANKTYRKKLPDIDSLEFIGFLFKYAVPKLEQYRIDYTLPGLPNTGRHIAKVALKGDDRIVEGGNYVRHYDWKYHTDDDPTLALFWAIYSAFNKTP